MRHFTETTSLKACKSTEEPLISELGLKLPPHINKLLEIHLKRLPNIHKIEKNQDEDPALLKTELLTY